MHWINVKKDNMSDCKLTRLLTFGLGRGTKGTEVLAESTGRGNAL